MGSSQKTPENQYIAGKNAVQETLETDTISIEKVMLTKKGDGPVIRKIGDAARRAGIPVQYVPETKLNSLTAGANHQGVIAIVSPVAYLDVDDMLSAIAENIDEVRAKTPLIVMFDRIEDPYNYGAILRTTVGCGAAGVIVPSKNMAPINAHTVKSSAGAVMRIPISRVNNLGTTVEMLKERGYWIVGADGEGETVFTKMDWKRPLVLIIGNEHSGISSALKAACDYRVSIPIIGDIESLNASVAAGILLFAARSGVETL